MRTYPIMLKLAGRGAVVVGAGRVGLRKARFLLDAGAEVTLIAPDAGAGEAPPEGVKVLAEAYRPELLAGALVVFACTDDAALNATVADDARRAGALVNVADKPEACDFFLPAAACEGDVVVAIGTGGSAPALAARLRDRMAAELPDRVGDFAALLEMLRGGLKARAPDRRRRHEIMKELADEACYQAFLTGGPQAVRERMNQLLAEKQAQRPGRCESSAQD